MPKMAGGTVPHNSERVKFLGRHVPTSASIHWPLLSVGSIIFSFKIFRFEQILINLSTIVNIKLILYFSFPKEFHLRNVKVFDDFLYHPVSNVRFSSEIVTKTKFILILSIYCIF